MPNASDPYGSFAFQERILKENKFFLATLDRNRENGLLGGTSPRSMYSSYGSPTKVRLNTLSGELECPRISTPRIGTPRSRGDTIPINKRTADLCVPASPHEKVVLEQRIDELEAALDTERKGKQAIQAQLRKLEELVEQRAVDKKKDELAKSEKEVKFTSLPPVPPTALRSPRRMPHNLY